MNHEPLSGLEEDLAEAIDKNFYEFYKRWTLDNPTASSSQKVNILRRREKHLKSQYSDSAVGEELGFSPQQPGNARSSCQCDQQEESECCNSSER